MTNQEKFREILAGVSDDRLVEMMAAHLSGGWGFNDDCEAEGCSLEAFREELRRRSHTVRQRANEAIERCAVEEESISPEGATRIRALATKEAG